MHDLDATENDTRAAEVLKPEHAPRALPSGRRSDDAFDGPVVLLNHVVQILDLTNQITRTPYCNMYGPDAFCKLLVRDVKTVCTHVSGLPGGRLPKHARSLDEIRAPRP